MTKQHEYQAHTLLDTQPSMRVIGSVPLFQPEHDRSPWPENTVAWLQCAALLFVILLEVFVLWHGLTRR